jgi:cyclic pyranopterin phosphate synthase
VVNKEGPLKMVDISDKENIFRKAEANGKIYLKKETIKAIREKKIIKGDPLSVAKLASIMAVKHTPDIIPLCHPLQITSIETKFNFGTNFIESTCIVTAFYKTGLEMEALTGVTAGLLNIWDMVKYLEKDETGGYPSTKITDIRVIKKIKG